MSKTDVNDSKKNNADNTKMNAELNSNCIEKEMKLLHNMATSGRLPSYPNICQEETYYTASDLCQITAYSSCEIDEFEAQLSDLWANNPELSQCIPIILAAIEKSRNKNEHKLIQTELYNYTM